MRLAFAQYQVGSAVLRHLPRPAAEALARTVYRMASEASEERRLLVERNLRRVLGDDVARAELDRLIRLTFESYGRYWVDSFRLPDLSVAEIDAGMGYEGFGPIAAAVAEGPGPILVLPHLGGWEWAGFWLTQVMGYTVTVVVEPVEPPELFDFFVEFRRSLGMNIVPLGPGAGAEVMRAVHAGHVVCLLTDRDIDGRGLEVDFFGERTTLPAGPATVGLRTGAPLIPTACYFRPYGIHCVCLPPVPAERQGRLRDDVARVTQDLGRALEDLIRRAPEQWHLQQPNWPSDYDALEGIGKVYPRPGERTGSDTGTGPGR